MASRAEERLVETYARALLEASKSEGRVFQNLSDLEVVTGASKELIAMLDALQQHGDLELLPEVCSMFRDLVESDDDIVGVEVTTAVPLDDHLRAVIERKCEADFGKKVFLIERVDPEIIGGVVLSARGKRRDASVRTQLAAARDVLAKPSEEGGAA